MTIKKIETYAKFTPRPLDTSKAEKYRAYANVGKQLMNMADKFAQTKAAQRGKEEGLLAVKESRKETLLPDGTTEVTYTPVERKSMGYAASSFNQTVDKLSTSMRVSDATVNIAKFGQEFKDDPVSFINTSNAYIDGLIEQTDPSQQEFLRQKFNQMVVPKYLTIKQNFETKELASNLQDLGNAYTNATEGMLVAIANGENADVYYQNAVDTNAEIKRLNPAFNETLANKNLNVARYNGKVEHSVLSLTKKENGLELAYAELAKLEKGKVPKNQTPDSWGKHLASIKSDLDRIRLNEKQAEIKTENDNKLFLNNYAIAVENGYSTTAEEDAQADAMVAGTDDEVLLKEAREVRQFSLSSHNVRQGILDDISESDVTSARLRDKLEAQEIKIQQQLAKDPMSYAIKQGIVEELEFNVLSPKAEDILALKEQQQKAMLHYGMQMPMLTGSQIDTLKNYFNSDNISAQEQFDLARMYGPKSYLWTKFSEKNQKLIAQAGSHPNPDVSLDMFIGQHRINKSSVKIKGKDLTDAQTEFRKYVGGDTLPAEDYTQIFNSVKAVYASKVGNGADYDEDAFKEAMVAVFPVDEVRDHRTALPQNVSGEELERYFNNMSPQEYTKIMGDVDDEKMSDDLQFIRNNNVRIKAVGPDSYILTSESNTRTATIVDEQGRPKIFTINEDVIANTTFRNGRTLAEVKEEARQKRAKKQAEFAEMLQQGGYPIPVPYSSRAVRMPTDSLVDEILNTVSQEEMDEIDAQIAVQNAVGYLGLNISKSVQQQAIQQLIKGKK